VIVVPGSVHFMVWDLVQSWCVHGSLSLVRLGLGPKSKHRLRVLSKPLSASRIPPWVLVLFNSHAASLKPGPRFKLCSSLGTSPQPSSISQCPYLDSRNLGLDYCVCLSHYYVRARVPASPLSLGRYLGFDLDLGRVGSRFDAGTPRECGHGFHLGLDLRL
uniref:Uncharacterized protein n=1 Tax=Cannabis sativa TaxID=3483 RepID=A0A803QRX6_CANSA